VLVFYGSLGFSHWFLGKFSSGFPFGTLLGAVNFDPSFMSMSGFFFNYQIVKVTIIFYDDPLEGTDLGTPTCLNGRRVLFSMVCV
jgi:hypothetical protein